MMMSAVHRPCKTSVAWYRGVTRRPRHSVRHLCHDFRSLLCSLTVPFAGNACCHGIPSHNFQLGCITCRNFKSSAWLGDT